MQKLGHRLQRSWQSHGLDDEWVADRTSSLTPNNRVASHRGGSECPSMSCLPGLAAAMHARRCLILPTPGAWGFRLPWCEGVNGMDGAVLPPRRTLAVIWKGHGLQWPKVSYFSNSMPLA